MGHKKVTARRQERRKNRGTGIARAIVGNFAYVLLGGAVLLFVAAIVGASGKLSSGAPSTSSTAASKSAATHAAATAQAGSGWITLSANTPKAIIAAARKTTLFNENRSGNGDYLKDLSHLENPVLVLALHTAGSVVLPDYYVIPIDDKSGNMVGAAELALNPTHTAVQLTAIVTYARPHLHGQLSQVTSATAVANVSRQQRTALRPGAQPMLVYIPIDASALETGQVTWSGGGLSPADPAWLVPGADGQNRVVGVNGRVYAATNIPIMKQP